jgi:aminoglycoside phosphotransferase (APT) family kinase protein
VTKHAPHGFSLDEDEHRLLRGRPPAAALEWVCGAVGDGSRLLSVRAQAGGNSSAVHRVIVTDSRGAAHRMVLRRYVRADWLAEEPDLAEREAEALDVLAAGAVPAPQLIAVDPTGERAGVPAVLMSTLSGRVDWAPTDVDRWIDGLVDVLPVIHATPVPDHRHLRPYRPYELGKPLAPPPWTEHPKAWERAIEVYEGPPPTDEKSFIHRDYHPGNVLWSRHRVSGVVDWANTSVGAPEADVGHCRANLAGYLDQSVADRFLARYEAVTGRTGYHPYWDIAVVVVPPEACPEPDPGLDDFLARAVAQL